MSSAAVPGVEDVYALSPLQQGMLILSLGAAGGGMYVNQALYEVENLHADALRKAWQSAVDRHAILRTSFHWEDLENPRQVVRRDVEVPFEAFDWTDASGPDLEQRLRKFLRQDRLRGFDLREAPLLRLAAFQTSATTATVYFAHHHLLLDGWSHPLLLREVSGTYHALLAGREPQLPESHAYRRYIDWLERRDVAKAEGFWRDYLRGFSTPTPLPADRGGTAAADMRSEFGAWNVEFTTDETARLQSAARRCQATLNLLIQAAWGALIARYAGVDDVVFGALVSGRPPELDDVESMIGMFLNSVPVRVRVDARERVPDWLRRLRDEFLEVQQHQYESLMTVQRWSDAPRGTPLFQSMIASADAPKTGGGRGGHGGGGGAASKIQRTRATALQQNYPLLLTVSTSIDQRLTLSLAFELARFESAAMTRLMEQLRTLLLEIADDPDRTVGELSLLSPEERDRILVDWNGADVAVPEDLCLHDLFTRQAVRTPEASAARFEGRQLTYGELDRRSDALARKLRELGAGREALVGLCAERSLDMTVGLLAILKSGAAYVPLDPNYPQERLAFMLADSGAKILLAEAKHADRFDADDLTVVRLDDVDPSTDATERLESISTPDDLAYVLYTSGSTGVPKGVAVPHSVSINRLHTEPDPIRTDETLCVKTSLSFVDSIWEMFSCWQVGACAVLVPDAAVRDPERLVETLATAGATRIVLVPSLLRALFDSEIDLAARLPRLREWISSGEPLAADLCRRFDELLPDRTLVNLYGTSEIWDATRCDSHERPGGQPIPIGRPMGNVRVYVLDEAMRPQPVGAPGELYVGGKGLARGYWRRPDLTAERFVPDPFSTGDGARLYRTGDRVRWSADGNLEHLGRFDAQCKIRGHRIELGEIEAVLREHPLVREAAIKVTSGEQLAAYVAPRGDEAPDLDELRRLTRKLPEPMRPAFFAVLPELPHTPSGKIDRRALPDPDSPTSQRAYVEPRTETEQAVAQVWASTLGATAVGLEDNFFELGGHSLTAVQAASRLRKLLGVEIALSTFFESPTVVSLAAAIDEARRNKSVEGDDAPELVRAERKEAPLTFAQQRLWFLDQLNPGLASYTIPDVARIPGPLDQEALEKALSEIVGRHESLRTTIAAVDGEPRQIVGPPREISLPVVDVGDVPEGEREAEIARHARRQARLPWDLANGPLVRFRLLRFSDHDHALVTSMHHIVSDGRSMGVYGRELSILYSAFKDRLPSPLPALPLQYADFAIWEREFVKGSLYAKQLDYWKTKLAGLVPLELPLDKPRPAVHRFQGARYEFSLPESLFDGLKRVAQHEGATSFMALLGVFQLLLARHAGQDDVIVGTALGTRSREELEPLIGMFVSTLVMRNDLSGDPTFRELLVRSKEMAVAAFANQDLPFEAIVAELQPDRDLSRQGSPLFQVMLVHNQVRRADGGGGRRNVDTQSSNFDLVLSTTESEGDLECSLAYNSDVFEPSTIERVARRFTLLVERGVADPDARLSQLSFLDEAERRTVLRDFALGTQVERDYRTLHEFVAEHASQFPDHPAATFADGSMSYGELDRRAERLARQLVRRGVGPEKFVGLCVQRSPEMLVGLLGILKAGGAFLPLDPAYPSDRLAFMRQTAGARVVLVHEKTRGAWVDADAELLSLDDPALYETVDAADEAPLPTVSPRNLAYVIFTSGSTGTPKGVLIEHRSFAHTILAQIPEFRVGRDSRVLQMLSLSFDAAVGEIFRALVAGATLHLASKDELMPGPGLAALIRDRRISVTALPPTALAAMPDEPLPDLKTLTVGGEACSAELASKWGAGRRLINGYGPTETTIGAALAADWDLSRKPPIGRPLANVRTYVLDARMQPVPVGVPGELFIGGPGVARGYLDRPDLTAERFLPDPYADEPGERMYRTGDLVRWLPDGQLDFLSRVDQQVKIRGYRIELGEIEAALEKRPDVVQAVVKVDQQRGVKRLAAYYRVGASQAPTVAELRAFLTDRLPEYMVPAFFVAVERFPVTPNGKIDKNALPAPVVDQLVSEAEFVAPRNDVETALANVWTSVLGVEKVGVDDNFFELGGDSILSIQIVARANELGFNLSAKDLFQRQTIAELAQVVGQKPDRVAAEQGAVEGFVPLTPIQRWFFEQDPPEPHHFNQWVDMTASPAMQADVLREALRIVVERHDALRLRYDRTESGWLQRIAPPDGVAPFETFDFSAVESDDERRQAEEAKTAEIQNSLDLERGPIAKVAWFYAGRRRPARLLFTVHHLAVDLVSWRYLMQDFLQTYRSLMEGRDPSPPLKTTSFKRWAEALVERAAEPSLLEELDFWLDPARRTVATAPLDRAEGVNDKASRETVLSILEADEVARIVERTRRRKLRMHEFAFAALAATLCRWTGDRRTLVNLEGHGREEFREDLDLSRTVGWFTNFYPALAELGESDDPAEVVRSVQEGIARTPARGLGYGLLRYLHDDEGVRTRLAAMPHAEFAFNYTGQQGGAPRGPGPVAEPTSRSGLSQGDQGMRQHLLEITAGIVQGRLQVRWTYSRNLHDSATIERLADDYLATLKAFAESRRTGDDSEAPAESLAPAGMSQRDFETLMAQLRGEEPKS